MFRYKEVHVKQDLNDTSTNRDLATDDMGKKLSTTVAKISFITKLTVNKYELHRYTKIKASVKTAYNLRIQRL